MHRILLPSVLLLSMIAPAQGCLNDSETTVSEQEFNSAYGSSGQARPRRSGQREFHSLSLLLLLPGAALLCLGGWWMVKERRARRAAEQALARAYDQGLRG